MSSLSGLRRFIFEAQALCVAQVKMSVEGTETERKFELVPAERNSRIEAQCKRLTGLALTGQLECAFSCYTYIGEILSADVITYPEPRRFIPRSQEVMREKPGKEIVLDESSRLTMHDRTSKDRCQIQTDHQLWVALQRRALCSRSNGAVQFCHHGQVAPVHV